MPNKPKDLLKQIEHAENQEKLAYNAKKQFYHDLCEELMRKYGDQIMDLEEVFALSIVPHYDTESTAIKVKIEIEPTYDQIEDAKKKYSKKTEIKNKIKQIMEEEIKFRLSLDRGEQPWNPQ